jgi:hypothetical protein
VIREREMERERDIVEKEGRRSGRERNIGERDKRRGEREAREINKGRRDKRRGILRERRRRGRD